MSIFFFDRIIWWGHFEEFANTRRDQRDPPADPTASQRADRCRVVEFARLFLGVTVVGKGDVGELILYTHVYMGIINKPLNMEKIMGHFFRHYCWHHFFSNLICMFSFLNCEMQQYHPTDLLRYFLVVDGFLSDSEVCNICISANVSQCSPKKSKASVVAFRRTDANPDGSAGRNNFEGFNTKRVYSVVGEDPCIG